MVSKHGISVLLQDLHKLYYKICAIDLRNRMSRYHRNTARKEAPDISTSLTKHFDKLEPASKPYRVSTASSVTTNSPKRPAKAKTTPQSSSQPWGMTEIVSAFIRPKKIFTRIKSTDQNMGDKLKKSTWSHIHTATLQARQGNLSNAKMHAAIANDALKEAAHYMSEENYKVFCDDVAKVFEALEG